MAKMYPPEISEDVKSDAEKRLFRLFKEQLPDGFIVMHSVGCLLRDPKNHDLDKEIDFLIIHPRRGLLVLEVKGGRIEVEGGRWYSIDRYDKKHELPRSPFEQARNNLYALMEKIAETPVTRPFQDAYRWQRGVVLPSVTVGREGFGTDAPREIIIDSTDLHSLELAVRRIMGSPGNKVSLPDGAIRALVDLLKPTRKVDRFGLGYQVLSAGDEIIELTREQYSVLDTLQLQRRALISGCAGSGKTMLAMEKARRLAAEGFRVLFTCYNENLGDWVWEQFQHDTNATSRDIHIAHYHKLAHDFCARAGVLAPPESSEDLDHYFSEVMPDRFLEALAILPDRFDAIIVDEGQDFKDLWWVTLLELLKDRDQGIFYIFYDDNQRIYQREGNFPFNEPLFPLRKNCRNTDHIHRRVVQYHSGTPKPRSSGLEGPEPEIVPVEQGNRVEALKKVFTRLLDEGIPMDRVVILSPVGRKKSAFSEGVRIGNLRLTWKKQPGANEVRVCTIHSFKGLESPVVILAELDRFHPESPRDELLYVATSRAQSHLIVLGELPEPVTQSQPASRTESDLNGAMGLAEDTEVVLDIAADPAALTETDELASVAAATNDIEPTMQTDEHSETIELRSSRFSSKIGRASIRRGRLPARVAPRPSHPSPRIGRGAGGEGRIPPPLALPPPAKRPNGSSIPPPRPHRATPRSHQPVPVNTKPLNHAPAAPSGNGWAVAGLLCGVLALFVHILAIAAIIIAGIGLAKVREHGGKGKISGWVGLALGVIVVLLMLQ